MHEHSKVILGANNFPPQHQYNDADYFAASSIFGDEARRPYPSKCHKWSNESSVEDSTFTYSFPTNSSVLHFTSRGHFVGTVDYVLAKSSASGKFINVSVTLGATGSYTGGSSKHDKHSYWIKLRPSWWPCKRRHPKKPRAKVCLLNEPGSQDPSGLAILVSRHSAPRAVANISLLSDAAESQGWSLALVRPSRSSEVSSSTSYPSRGTAPSSSRSAT